MIRMLALVGAVAGGWLGSALGARVGIGTAWLLGSAGSFVGIYVGWRVARALTD